MTELALGGLLALENDGWAALCASRGGSFYGRLMTSDGLMVLVNGMVMDRDAIAASLDGSPAWSSYSIEQPRLVSLGEQAAALVYHAAAQRVGDDGQVQHFDALMTSVYRMVKGRPRLALYQQTGTIHYPTRPDPTR